MSEHRKFKSGSKPDVAFPLADSLSKLPNEYLNFMNELKAKIKTERHRAVLSANQAMIELYWHIGKAILLQQEKNGWGAKVIDRMAYDLKNEFLDMKGFSPRNLKYMRKFAQEWPEFEIVQRCVAQIPWRSNITLLDKLKDKQLRLWYAQKVIEKGMGKDMLVFQIESQLHLREGNTVNNFSDALPDLDSDYVNQNLKDPYIFDFVGNANNIRERELENKLTHHIQKFLLELGDGFAFVGRQVHLELGGDDFYIDLLFYHLKLRCYVVIELKAGKFEPGYVSKLNMYQNVVNDTLKHPDDAPTIGLLLVKEKNRLVAEYALAGFRNPIGVANWESEIAKTIPQDIKSSLPSIEEIEKELERE